MVHVVQRPQIGGFIAGLRMEELAGNLRQGICVARRNGLLEPVASLRPAPHFIQLAPFARHLPKQLLRLGLQAAVDRELSVGLIEIVLAAAENFRQTLQCLAVAMFLQCLLGSRQQLEDFAIGRSKVARSRIIVFARIRGNHSGPSDYSAAEAAPLSVAGRCGKTNNRERNRGQTEQAPWARQFQIIHLPAPVF